MSSSGHTGYAAMTTSFFGEKKDHSRLGGPQAWTIWILATVFVARRQIDLREYRSLRPPTLTVLLNEPIFETNRRVAVPEPH